VEVANNNSIRDQFWGTPQDFIEKYRLRFGYEPSEFGMYPGYAGILYANAFRDSGDAFDVFKVGAALET